MATVIKNATPMLANTVEFVDLSEQPAKAKIVRQGYDVPQPKIDLKKAEQFIGDLVQIPVPSLPRVVVQGIAPGTKVAAGTVVDLVLAPRSKIPFAIFDNPHADLVGKNLDAIDVLVADPATRKTLLSYQAGADVPQVEKDALTQKLGAAGIHVDAGNSQKDFERAFETVRGALTFQG
jgi:hypothetical protein